MLSQIQIRNFAIVDKLDLELHPGLNVITGETGAGKSIVIDALSLCLGERAENEMIRHGCERAEISALFELQHNPTALRWLKKQELDDENQCIIRRVINRESRSRAFINGVPVPVQQLRELGDCLVDIHGQNAHQSLMKNAVQRDILDRFGGHAELTRDMAAQYQQWQDLLNQWQSLQQSAQEREYQMGLLQHHVDELQSLALQTGEWAMLQQEHGKLAHASRLLESCQHTMTLLEGNDDGGAMDLIGQCSSEIGSCLAYDEQLRSCHELLNCAEINLHESISTLRHYLDQLDMDPQRLKTVEERLALVHNVTRKHHVEADELPVLCEKFEQQLELLKHSDERRESLQADISASRQRFIDIASRVSSKRRTAAGKLAKLISAAMQTLGMPGGKFDVGFEPLQADHANSHGLEKITYQVSANPGQPLKPLSKVASGGELSRISLAIQVSISDLTRIPTLIYDEVDVGIGGATAEMVGRQLRRLSSNRQLISVTHLPQVAAQGHFHYRVNKHVARNRTQTRMVELDADQRVEEIARMLGGLEMTEQTLAHAAQMLHSAEHDQTMKPVNS